MLTWSREDFLGIGLCGEFLWGRKMFVECPSRACDSQQKSRLFFFPDVATNNPLRETTCKILNEILLPQKLGMENFQVGPTEKFFHFIKQSLTACINFLYLPLSHFIIYFMLYCILLVGGFPGGPLC